MLDNLFGSDSSHSDQVFEWTWAQAHPLLFTIIKISQPSLIAIVMALGISILTRLLMRKK